MVKLFYRFKKIDKLEFDGGNTLNQLNTKLWWISLLIIIVVTVIWAVCNLIGTALPDITVRLMGVLDILAVFLLIFTSVKKRIK